MRIRLIVIALLTVCPALAALADEINLPPRKPGEWKVDMQIAGHPMAMQICVDAATDKSLMQTGLSVSSNKCSSISASQNGNTITIDATCTVGAMTSTAHTVVTGDFQSAYTIDTVSDVTGGPAAMPKHSEIKQNVTWVGPCPSGLKAGEMQMPSGMKINPLEMMKPGG